MASRISRRGFGQVVVATALAAPTIVRGQNLNSKLNLAIIGAGGRGGENTKQMASENIAVLCDIDDNYLAQAKALHPDATTFNDLRKVFDKPNAYDACVISTTEHTHFLATMLAMKAGKHVYVEKPISHNVWEARQLREYAAKNPKLVTQMGTQLHASENMRRTYEILQTGVLGGITEVHVWVSRAWGLQSEADSKKYKDRLYVADRPNPKVAPVPPKGLHYDLWVGPAPMRPYDPIYFPGPNWYRWWDFGNGTMSDLGSHWNDLPFWALKLQAPTSIESTGPKAHPEIAAASFSVEYKYPAREKMPAVKFVWYQGEPKPPQWTAKQIPQVNNGVLFVGEKGMLLFEYGKFHLLPEKAFADFQEPAKSLPRVASHQIEWIEAIKTGKRAMSDFQYSGWLTEANHLGNVAFRVGKKLEWDAVKLKATNAPEADAFLRREYRKGWEA